MTLKLAIPNKGRLSDRSVELLSKAGHDAMAVATLTRYAMLFVRCGNGGVSHHPDESVTDADVALAIDAFEAAVLWLARERAS